MWFNIKFNKLTIENVPGFLRKAEQIAFVKAFVAPITRIYNRWYALRQEHFYKLEHNGQICFFEKALNDAFDPVLRRIYIKNGNKFKRTYIYTHNETKPRFLGKLFLRQRNDFADTGVNFIVFAPSEVVNRQFYELDALIEFYKDGAKTHKIERI